MFEKGQARLIDASLRVRVANILAVLDAAASALDLAGPGNRLHEMQGAREGVWSVTVSGNWRITFRFADGNAHDVDLDRLPLEETNMPMKNHPHPGRIVRQDFLEPLGLTVTEPLKCLALRARP